MAKMKYVEEVEKGASAAADGRASVGPVYRSVFAKDVLPQPTEGVESCWDVFRLSVEKYPNNRKLGGREVVNGKAGKCSWLRYTEAYGLVKIVGWALRSCRVGKRMCREDDAAFTVPTVPSGSSARVYCF